MQLSITTDYGVRVLIFLAGAKRSVTSKELSEALNISHQYIFRVGDMLKKLGLIVTINGPAGGFLLNKKPEEITMYEVLNGIEGTIKITKCLEKSFCSRNALNFCSMHKFYASLQNEFENKLKAKTIADLIETKDR